MMRLLVKVDKDERDDDDNDDGYLVMKVIGDISDVMMKVILGKGANFYGFFLLPSLRDAII